MSKKSKTSVSIIGGADGPTSVYIAGRTGKKPIKAKIWNYIYKFRRNKAEKQIVAGAHTLEEVVAYAIDTYHAVEVNKEPYDGFVDLHVFEMYVGDGCLEMELDYIAKIFGVSYSGNKRVMKQLKKIAQDLYLYYGVTEEDIKNKSERYSSLLAILSM